MANGELLQQAADFLCTLHTGMDVRHNPLGAQPRQLTGQGVGNLVHTFKRYVVGQLGHKLGIRMGMVRHVVFGGLCPHLQVIDQTL